MSEFPLLPLNAHVCDGFKAKNNNYDAGPQGVQQKQRYFDFNEHTFN